MNPLHVKRNIFVALIVVISEPPPIGGQVATEGARQGPAHRVLGLNVVNEVALLLGAVLAPVALPVQPAFGHAAHHHLGPSLPNRGHFLREYGDSRENKQEIAMWIWDTLKKWGFVKKCSERSIEV